MRKTCWAWLLTLSLLALPFAGAAEELTLQSLGLTVESPAGYVVIRESKSKKTKEVRSIKPPIKQTESPAEQNERVEEFLLH